jgi:hypothetical protein
MTSATLDPETMRHIRDGLKQECEGLKQQLAGKRQQLNAVERHMGIVRKWGT